MNLSKSKYCNAVQCKKILWLNKYKSEVKEEISNDSVLENGTEVGNLAKELFSNRIDIEYSEDLNKMIEDTKKALEKSNVTITEASFVYENNFCSVDILVKKGDYFELYEVKSSTELKDIYLDDISYQYYVLTSLGYKVTKANIIYINSKYIRNGDLELNKLFNIEDVSEIVISKQEEVKSNINDINNYMKQTCEPDDDIDLKCFSPYDCPFFKYCTRNLPDDNVFNIRRMRTSSKMKLYKSGIYKYDDVLKEDIDWKFKQQIEFELFDKEPLIDKEKIVEFLDTLYYPMYFLDFETYQQAIPLYDGISPYMQVPFQYSLHYIENENNRLEHKEFLAVANIDPRRKLAEQLVNDIPKDSCVIAYNMMFEKMVIRNLASLYKDLSVHLMNIHDNMKDLMIPFKDRNYYTKEMYGSYSIKYVLPALFPNDPSLNYHNLELIHNGGEASNAYANLGKLSNEEQEIVRKNLLKYCELDTFAMVKIWKLLEELKND